MMKYDVVIIGSGSVGSFAGYYASRQGLKTCLIDNFYHHILMAPTTAILESSA